MPCGLCAGMGDRFRLEQYSITGTVKHAGFNLSKDSCNKPQARHAIINVKLGCILHHGLREFIITRFECRDLPSWRFGMCRSTYLGPTECPMPPWPEAPKNPQTPPSESARILTPIRYIRTVSSGTPETTPTYNLQRKS